MIPEPVREQTKNDSILQHWYDALKILRFDAVAIIPADN